SIGRASVSKTEGCRFDSYCPCHLSPGRIPAAGFGCIMSNPGVQTVSSVAERAKVALAIAAFIAGLAGFYILGDQPMIVRVGAVIAGIIVAVVIAWFSEPGRRFLGFAQDSYNEVRRVVWPTRKETIQMTATVFAFVVVMALFLWVADKLIEWVLYGLLLGWH